MKLFSFSHKNQLQKNLGLLINNMHFDISTFAESPMSIHDALIDWDNSEIKLKGIEEKIKQAWENTYRENILDEENIIFHAPTTEHCSFRDFYAFLQHVKTARALRGLDVIEEWYQIPVFYFSNPRVFLGHNQKLVRPGYTKELDLELEIACIIGHEGTNIKRENANDYIAGYTILNDFSARDAQRLEMRVGLGPAKGKDFATGLGPYLVTTDEFSGLGKNKSYNLQMKAHKNGAEISNGNFADIYYGFDEMIERASQGVTLYPGDVLGSGTVGTGCILERRPENTDGWLKPGDTIELEIVKLGKLTHFIV